MAVYDYNGNAVQAVYNIDGEQLHVVYDKDGNIISGELVPDWENYSISNLFNYPLTKMQGFAVYDGKIAQVREDYSLHIIDISTGTLIKEVTMDMGHGNSCQFSDVFYDAEDEFPLFYIRNDGVWVYRIVDTSSTLIRKYSFPLEAIYTYVAGFGIDNENKLFYTASYTEGNYETKTGLLCICKWDMDDVTNNGDGTYSMALLDTNTFTWFDKYEAVQGCCFRDGYFFIDSGYTGTTSQDIVLVDAETLSIAHNITLGRGNETEGCAWISADSMIVGQKNNTYTYRKIQFDMV